MTDKEKLEYYEELFEKLRPFVILAINDYYFNDDKDKLEDKLNELGYNIQ